MIERFGGRTTGKSDDATSSCQDGLSGDIPEQPAGLGQPIRPGGAHTNIGKGWHGIDSKSWAAAVPEPSVDAAGTERGVRGEQ